MAAKVMGISWLNGRFRAAVVRRDTVVATWSAPERVVGLDGFAGALKQALKETGFRGHETRLVMDNRDVVYHLEEAPPGKPAIVQRLLDRIVKQRLFFDESALWGFHAPSTSPKKPRVLLTLIAESTGETLQRICDQAGLRLSSVVSPAAILAGYLTGRQSKPDEPLLLAACADKLLCLLTGSTDGGVYFSRTVSLEDESDGARVVQEINRTLLFTQQQFGLAVNHCRLLNDTLQTAVSGVPAREGQTFSPVATGLDEFQFAVDAARLRAGDANMVAHSKHVAPSAQRGLAWAAGVMLTASLALAGLIEFGIAVSAREQSRLDDSLDAGNQQSFETEERLLEMLRRQTVLAALDTAENPPVVLLFTKHLAAVTPGGLTLTAARAREDEKGGWFRIEGFGDASVSSLVRSLEEFEAALRESSFQPVIGDSSLRRMFQDSPVQDGVEALRSLPNGTHEFFIEGRLP